MCLCVRERWRARGLYKGEGRETVHQLRCQGVDQEPGLEGGLNGLGGELSSQLPFSRP